MRKILFMLALVLLSGCSKKEEDLGAMKFADEEIQIECTVGKEITIYPKIINLPSDARFSWFKDGKTISTEPKLVYTALQPGTENVSFFVTAEGKTPLKRVYQLVGISGNSGLVPPAGHPRVFILGKDIEDMKAKFNNPAMADLKQALLTTAAAKTEGTSPNGNPYSVYYMAAEANAFLYIVNKDEKAGMMAKKLIQEHLRSVGTHLGANEEFGMWQARICYDLFYASAIVYDWCYDLFNPAERKEMIQEVNRIAYKVEKKENGGWPLDPKKMNLYQFVGPHWSEGKHPAVLAFGIACYDEDPTLYTQMAEHLYGYFVPVRNFYYKAHKHPQSSSYGMARFYHEIMSTALIKGMGQSNPYNEKDQSQMYYYYIYTRRPDGQIMPEGDDFTIFREPGYYFNANSLIYASGLFKDPILQAEAKRYWNNNVKDTNNFDPTLLFAMYDPDVPVGNVDNLPLARYFGSPMGTMIMRTGWDMDGGPESDVAIVKMDIQEFDLTGHAQRDAGNFTIYHKGPLAIDSGAYTESENGQKFGGPHHKNYLTQTVAHNAVLINDASGKNGEQPTLSQFKDMNELMEKNRRAYIHAHIFGPDQNKPEYTYLKADLAPAYKSHVLEAKRSFVTFKTADKDNPICLIVADRIETKGNSIPKWLLHSEQEPRIMNNVTTIRKTEGKQHYKGELVNTTLLPASTDRMIQKVGGKGKEFWNNGQNWALKDPAHIDTFEAGRWRIEVSPRTASSHHFMLNAIQVRTAYSATEPAKTELVESDKYYGAKVGDKIAFFSKSGKCESDSFTLELPAGSGDYTVLVTDAVAGNWKVSGAANLDIIVTEDGQSLFFKGPAGKYNFKKN